VSGGREQPHDWLRAFLPLGAMRGDTFLPHGAGVLIVDRPFVWLVTASAVLEALEGQRCCAFVPRQQGHGLLDLTTSHERLGLGWLRHASAGLAACLLPIEPSFDLRAFAVGQCARLADVLPMQPAVSVGCAYGLDTGDAVRMAPLVFDGIVAGIEAKAQRILTTAPLVPRNLGAPLLLASPYGGPVQLAGILLGERQLAEPDPRALPLRLGVAVSADAAFELIHGPEGKNLRERAARVSGAAGPSPGVAP
jgi:hypothetical protein